MMVNHQTLPTKSERLPKPWWLGILTHFCGTKSRAWTFISVVLPWDAVGVIQDCTLNLYPMVVLSASGWEISPIIMVMKTSTNWKWVYIIEYAQNKGTFGSPSHSRGEGELKHVHMYFKKLWYPLLVLNISCIVPPTWWIIPLSRLYP